MEQTMNDFLSEETELVIENETSGYLIETSKWAKFIAVTFYIIAGLVILIFVAYGSTLMRAFEGFRRYDSGSAYTTGFFIGFIVALIVIAAVVGVTYYFLLSFANKMRTGIETENIEMVNNGLRSLKVHFIIIGILMILGLLMSAYNLVKTNA